MSSLPWLLLDTGPRPAPDNMAVDEMLLEEVAALGRPVLRFYAWSIPAATFGYFQRFDVLARRTTLRPLIRRPTGGGLVPHAADWTYSLVFPPGHPWWQFSARQSYQQLHQWLAQAFARLQVETFLAPHPRTQTAPECFLCPEQHDLLWQQQKIAGAAQRRNRRGLLIQGSVQPPPGPAKRDWQAAMGEVARTLWSVDWVGLELSPGQEERVAELVRAKYGREDYNRRR